MPAAAHVDSHPPGTAARSSAVFGNPELLAGESLFNQLVMHLTHLLLWLGLLAFSGDLLRSVVEGFSPLIYVQATFIAIIIAIFLVKKRLAAVHTATAAITALYGVSIVGLAAEGPGESSSALALAGAVVVTGVLFGRLAALRLAGLVALSIGAVAAATRFAGDSTGQPPIGDWINVIIDVPVISFAVVLFVAAIQKRLIRAVEINRKENNFTQAIVNAAHELLFVFNPRTGKLIYWNDAFRNFTELSDDEIAQRPVPEGWTDRFRAEPDLVRAAVKRIARGGKRLFEVELVTPSGRGVPMEFHAVTVDLPEQGKAILCMGRDLAERRALRETERYLRLITESLPVVIWAADREGRPVYVSPNVADVCGFSAEEVKQGGMDLWMQRIHEEDRDGVAAAVSDLAAGDVDVNHRFRFLTKDGREIWLHERGVSAETKFAGAPAACGVFCDVTEQVKTAEHLRRTEKLEILGQLAGGVAHDFNNQLAGILGITDLLEMETLENPGISRYVGELKKCAQHAASLPKQLLTFSRKGASHLEPMNVHDIVRETVTILGRSIGKSVVITPRLEAENAVVSADPSRLQNALLNLCINARDAMPSGGEIVIETHNRTLAGDTEGPGSGDLGGQYLEISVRDTGEGMSEAVRNRIFDPFFTTKPEGKGTGLGLAMVSGFVKSLSGAISVDSAPSKGTAITLTIPLFNIEELDAAAAEPASILLVDDEPEVLHTVAEMLRDMGFEVVAHSSAEAAVAEYRRRPVAFSLVIVDMYMPEMAGPEVLAEIKRIDPDARVLVISAMATEERFQESLRQGALGYLPKPFSPGELLDKVRTISPTPSAAAVG